MRDLDRALDDIAIIRGQIARGSTFQGYGPAAVALTGVFALATASWQGAWLDAPADRPFAFVAGWAAVAAVSVGLVGAEMLARSRRHHSGMADAMAWEAIRRFVPSGVAGALLAVVILAASPGQTWMLPGLWSVMVGLAVFSAAPSLPRRVSLAGAWYIVAGMAALLACAPSQAPSPWAMGIPFGVGQALMAALLHLSQGGRDGRA